MFLYSFGSRVKIDPSEDFTRLTLDAIALCAMSYRYAFSGSCFSWTKLNDACIVRC